MANFTHGIKREFLAVAAEEENRAARTAALAALMRTSGSISYTQGGLGFVLTTESEGVAEYAVAELEESHGISCLTNAAEDRLSGRHKLTLTYNGAAAYDLFSALGIFEPNEEGTEEIYAGIPARVIADDESKLAYVRGAFLGSGSCTVPRDGAKTGYHLEFIFSNARAAEDFSALLAEYDLIAKIVPRKENYVVYATSFSAISDFLAITGAERSLEKLNRAAEAREKSNRSNRANNCFVGNMDRAATAAANQCVAIERLKERGVLEKLSEELRLTAEARLKNAECSLSELAARLKISKSCLNHRLRRLTELYEETRKTDVEREE